MNYRAAKAKSHREKCQRGGRRSAEVRRAKMMASESQHRPRDPGAFLGVLELRLADDAVRRWVIRQGPRRNNITVALGTRKAVCGWDALLNGIRPHLAVITRQAT